MELTDGFTDNKDLTLVEPAQAEAEHFSGHQDGGSTPPGSTNGLSDRKVRQTTKDRFGLTARLVTMGP